MVLAFLYLHIYGAFCMHVFTHVFLRFNYLMGYWNTRWLCYTVMLSSFLILKKCDVESHKTAVGCYRIWKKKGWWFVPKKRPLEGTKSFWRQCLFPLLSWVVQFSWSSLDLHVLNTHLFVAYSYPLPAEMLLDSWSSFLFGDGILLVNLIR